MSQVCIHRTPRIDRGLAAAFVLSAASVVAAQPSAIGQWDGPYTFGSPPPGYTPGQYEAIHMLHLPDAATQNAVIMYFDFSQAVLTWRWAPAVPPPPGVIYPVSGNFALVGGYQGQDLVFCGGHSHLADGRVLIAGGDTYCSPEIWLKGNSSVYSWSVGAGNLVQHASMAERRWYPTCTTLADGRVLVTGGTYQTIATLCQFPQEFGVPSVEVFTPSSGAMDTLPYPLESPGALDSAPIYPFMFLLPNGSVYYAGSGDAGNTCLELTSLQGEWQPRNESSENGEHSTSAVMFLPGKILMCGNPYGVNAEGYSEQIDLTLDTENAQWERTGYMHYGRFNHNLVILPDGRVLATGGHSTHETGRPQHGHYIRATEVFDPATGLWTLWATAPTDRGYHSTAILLPDGRILSAGGDDEAWRERPYLCEYFEPPYLHTGATRPEINVAPSHISPEESFVVELAEEPTEIVRGSLIRLAATTHGFDMNQRYVPLQLLSQDGVMLEFAGPESLNVAPPGDYMLFVLEWYPGPFFGAGQWVPSVAKYVRVQ